jgi:hypothetical protein
LTPSSTIIYFESTRLHEPEFHTELFQASWDPHLETFAAAEPLAALASTSLRNRPCIATSGHELFFSQQVRDWDRNSELWVAWRASLDEPFTDRQARPLVEINSAFDEFAPVVTDDGKSIFWTGFLTNSHEGGADFNASSLWMATRDEPFDPSRHNAPPPFGSARKVRLTPDVHVLSATVSGDWPAEGAKLYFVSCLASECSQLAHVLDIYSATWHVGTSAPRF